MNNPLISTQILSLIECIRLLETFVASPLGLHSDIKMLRESLPFSDAEDLTREEIREHRVAYEHISGDRQRIAHSAVESIAASLDMLEAMTHDNGDPALAAEWVRRARMVAQRAERHISSEMRAATAARMRGLYVIVDPEATRGRDVLEVARGALRGGANIIQLRDKTRDKGEIIDAARELRDLCDAYKSLFIINDDADLAAAADAHGLHVGQTDLSVADARRALPPISIVGRSNNGVAEALDSQNQGADYIAVGAVFQTTTMGKSGRTSLGAEMISKVKSLVSKPVVAIGGINADNIADVARAGADCVCVVSAVTYASDPAAAAADLSRRIAAAKRAPAGQA